MTIKGVSPNAPRGADAAGRGSAAEPTPALQLVTGEVGGVRGIDAVSISDAGRALAAGDPAAGESTALDPRRAAELRRKILSGAYDSTEVADRVARAILSRGDL